MREASLNKHIRVNKRNSPVLYEYLKIGHSLGVPSPRNARSVLQAWSKIQPEAQHEFSGIVSLCIDPKSHLKEGNKTNPRVLINTVDSNLNRLRKKLGFQDKTHRKQVGSQTSFYNNPLDSLNSRVTKQSFYQEHFGQVLRNSLDRLGRASSMDFNAYHNPEEQHSCKKCTVSHIQYHKAMQVSLKHWKKIYITCIRGACNYYYLKKHNIYAILSLGENSINKYPSIKGGYVTHNSTESVEKSVEELNNFLRFSVRKGNALIHCYSGDNKSCSILAGFFMKQFRCSLELALKVIHQDRPSMSISGESLEQLKKYERVCLS